MQAGSGGGRRNFEKNKKKNKTRSVYRLVERGNLKFVECPEFCQKSVFGLNNLNLGFCIVSLFTKQKKFLLSSSCYS